MFRIGEFSRFSRVSIKMLRRYDEQGLFKPARVDPDSGYRYYSAEQLPRLNRLIALKDLGFTLEQIGVWLDGDLSLEQIRGMLKLRRVALEQQLHETTSQLAQIDSRLAQIEEAQHEPPYDVVVRSVAPHLVAGIRHTLGSDDQTVTDLFEALEGYVGQFKARAPLPPQLIYHDVAFEEQGEDVEVLVPLDKEIPINGRVSIRELRGHAQVACLIHTGRYDGLTRAFAVLLHWVEQHGYTIAGPTRERYLRFGASQDTYRLPDAYLTQNATSYVTELQIPIEGQDGG